MESDLNEFSAVMFKRKLSFKGFLIEVLEGKINLGCEHEFSDFIFSFYEDQVQLQFSSALT